MSRNILFAIVTIAACGKGDEPVTSGVPAPAVAHVPARIATGVPHGGNVAQIAVTEQGDAALSSDNIGAVRLWPSLDGKRPPVPVLAVAPSQLALAHAGDDLLAAILDQAGTVRLFRLGLDGAVHSRTQLDSDVPAEQVIAVGSSVLVRRIDHSIEKFDANGMSRGKLVSQSGERITAIAARHDSAIALIATGLPNGANTLRWIVATDDLRWGTSVFLPEQVSTEVLALSPDHRRIAAMNLRTSNLQVFAVDPLAKRVFGDATITISADAGLGFFDDDRVVVVTRQLQWWSVTPNQDPWAGPIDKPPPPPIVSSDEGGAIGDGVVVTSHGAALALTDPHTTKYLGWTDLAVGTPIALGDSIAFAISSTRISWLDDRLGRVHDFEVKDAPAGSGGYAIPAGDHDVVIQRQIDGKSQIEFVDVDHPDRPVAIGSFPTLDLFQYFPAVHILAIGSGGIIHRFRLDPLTRASLELTPLKPAVQISQLWLTDPARADGAVAIGTGWDDEAQRLQTFRETKPLPKIIKGTSSNLDGTVMLVDPTGTVHYRYPDGTLFAKRGGKQITTVDLDKLGVIKPADNLTLSDDGTRIVVIRASGLTLIDTTGKVRWEHPLWGILTATFVHDGKSLLVRASNGLIMLDAETGARLATACAWGFGLHDQATSEATFGQPPLCEDGS